jgi:hypothetical protein
MVLMILFGLQLKHLICDWWLQGPYQYKHKGIYGHPGGLLHSAIAVVGTTVVLGLAWPWLSSLDAMALLTVVALEFLYHYHVDWAKVQINRWLGLGPMTHEAFWWLLGFDQFLHQISYLAIAWFLQ